MNDWEKLIEEYKQQAVELEKRIERAKNGRKRNVNSGLLDWDDSREIAILNDMLLDVRISINNMKNYID